MPLLSKIIFIKLSQVTVKAFILTFSKEILNIRQQLSTAPNLDKIVTSPVDFTNSKLLPLPRFSVSKEGENVIYVLINYKFTCGIINFTYGISDS